MTGEPPQALAGIRVVEYGDGISAPYAGKLFADLGADVIKVEPPTGDVTRRRGPFPAGQEDPEASGLFLYLNANKQGLVLDLAAEDGRASFRRLLATADVLISNSEPREYETLGLEPSRILVEHPRLVYAAITPFGLRGPNSGYRGGDLIASAAGGWMSITPGGLEDSGADLPPLKTWGDQADYQVGLQAAVAAMAALLASPRQGASIETSAQEALIGQLEVTLAKYTYLGENSTRFSVHQSAPTLAAQAKDGLVFICCPQERAYRRLIEVMGDPDWAEDEKLATRAGRNANRALLGSFIEEWTRGRTIGEILELAQKARLPISATSTIGDVMSNEHLSERSFFTDIPAADGRVWTGPGAPYTLPATPWSLRSPAPELGAQNDGTLARVAGHAGSPDGRRGPAGPGRRPLEGLRVADFSWFWAGPYCTRHLAALGAEVIKIENHKRIDHCRLIPPMPGEQDLNASGCFNEYNQGKRSIAVDMGSEEGRRIALDLVARSDVAVENFAPGVMEKLGLGYDTLSEVNPSLVMVSISGFGDTGPLRSDVALGMPLVFMSGLALLTGYRDGRPRPVGMSYADPNGGIHACFALLAALWHRERTGTGQHIRVSLFEALLALMPEAVLTKVMTGEEPAQLGNRHPLMAPHGAFRAAGDDDWIAIIADSDESWRAIVDELHLDVDPGDGAFATTAARKRNEDALEEMIAAAARRRDRWELTHALQARDVAAFPVLTCRDIAKDPHLKERRYFTELPHPTVGVKRHCGVPWRIDGTDVSLSRPAPMLGEANGYVLREVLGYPNRLVEQLESSGVIAQPTGIPVS